MYSEQEVQEVQDMLAGKRKLSAEEIELLRNEFANKQIPNYLGPFVSIFATNKGLYEKLSQDALIRNYSYFAFLPEIIGLVYGSEELPKIYFTGGNRGVIGIITHPTKKIVIKPYQNSREHEVARIASELEAGPKQLKTLEGFLTEEFVEGDLFSKLGRIKNQTIRCT